MFDKARLRERIVQHLQEICVGKCEITDEAILEEEDPDTQEILAGLLMLHEDLEYERSRGEVARQLAEANAKLEGANTKLEETNRRLHLSNRDLEQFAYVASHDLQAPLRMIAGFADVLRARCEDQLDEGTMRYIHRLQEGAQRMQRLVAALLKLSRIESRSMTIQPVSCDDVLDRVIEVLRPDLEAIGAEVVVDELPTLMGDSVQLTQLFQNLMQNAIKFRGEAPLLISIEAKTHGKHCTFTISDNGQGFDSKNADRIFEMFTRVSTATKHDGSGMGLAIVRKIAEHHGGKVWAHAELGKGATFFVRLPLRLGV